MAITVQIVIFSAVILQSHVNRHKHSGKHVSPSSGMKCVYRARY
jgi:hypothetical protein